MKTGCLILILTVSLAVSAFAADPVTDTAVGSVQAVTYVAGETVETVGGAAATTADVTGQSAMSVVHHGPLGLVVRVIAIPFKVLEYALTGTRGLKGLHNVVTRPYEGP